MYIKGRTEIPSLKDWHFPFPKLKGAQTNLLSLRLPPPWEVILLMSDNVGVTGSKLPHRI